MKSRMLLLVISIFMLAVSKAQNKIGYVNVDKIFAEMPETKKADTALAAYQESLAKAYQEQQDQLNAEYSKFIKDSATMTAQVKATNRKKMSDDLEAYNAKGKELDQLLLQEKEKMVKPIREKIITTLQDYAKQNGYGHILYENNALVLNTEDDITTKIIDKLKAK